MFRKAMLAAVSVFMFSLSGNLQCSIALLIMIVSLTTHLIVQPYKSQLAEIRNKETMSLCGSTFIYLVSKQHLSTIFRFFRFDTCEFRIF